MSANVERHSDGQSVTVRVPLAFRRRGGRKQVVVSEGSTGPASAPRSARVDGTLVKALARAHRWQGVLESGEYGTVEEPARAERINPSYLARLLRPTLLAPEIVEVILNRRHDPERITLQRLMKPFPTEWEQQVGKLQSAAWRPLRPSPVLDDAPESGSSQSRWRSGLSRYSRGYPADRARAGPRLASLLTQLGSRHFTAHGL